MFPPVPPGTTDPNKIIATNIESAIANTLRSVTAFVDKSNAEAVDGYLNQIFPEWSKLASDGHADINNPPQPPRKIVIVYFTDQTTVSPDGPAPVRWPSWDFSSDPVCPMPPLPVRTPPPTIQLRTDILPVPLGDVSPVGSKITDPASGRVYVKRSSPTPFGTAYWYEQVSA